MGHTIRQDRARDAVRQWVDSISGVDLQAARQVQRALDLSLHGRLPEPEVIESDWADLMPLERALFGAAFQDTLPPATEAA